MPARLAPGRRRVREVVHEPGTGSHAWALQCRFEYADQIRDSLVALAGSHRRFEPDKGGGLVLAEAPDTGEIIERVAALDVGKVELVCCVRVPDEGTPARRMQEVSTHSTMTRSLVSMSGRLRCLGVTRVVMEATPIVGRRRSTCWRRRGSTCGWSTPGTSSTCLDV